LEKFVIQEINPKGRKFVWVFIVVLDIHVLHEQQGENRGEDL
jgi:hypothetical protein